MGSVEYSAYPFSYQPTNTDKTEKNDKKETPVIEGIANFCALNRSYANQNTQGWNNLKNAINNKNNQSSSSNDAKKTNTLLKTSTGTIVSTNLYTYTCGGIYGKIFKQDGTTISPNGTVYAYSTDLKIQRGSASVNATGKFNGLDVKLINSTEKFVFAYEDTAGMLWSVDIISGSSAASGASCSANNKNYVLKIATRKRFGDASQSRDPNGKLINTELKNSGAELRYNGMKAIYAETIANTMNLGIGVLVAVAFIAKAQ